MSQRYSRSEQLLARAQQTIPLGAQTFSKSITQFPYGASPYFAERGKGARLWDVDGNQYLDFVNGLCAVNLGYCDPDVDQAVRDQLEKGVVFTLSHVLEADVAEWICEVVPCAMKVRFGKNGSDATAGAVRIARAYTRRDHIAVCGYHGWQDWYIGSTTRNLGVPHAVNGLTHAFAYNKIEALHDLLASRPNDFAAVIMEPMSTAFPKDGYLEAVKELTHKHGALLIFDETITGFRFAPGGAQEFFGVTPDLATLGKGLANGYPLSAVVGRADVMKLMEEVFFSFTFGGETLSLAAAKATIEKVRSKGVPAHMAAIGTRLVDALKTSIEKSDLGDVLGACGHPTWSFLTFKDTDRYTSWDIKTYYLQEMFQSGILTLGTHNISYAHTPQDIDTLASVWLRVFADLKNAISEGSLQERLFCTPLRPLFKVR